MDLLNDQQFLEYRVKEIEEGVNILRQVGRASDWKPDFFLGAMEMLKRIINLPEKMIPEESHSQREQAKMLKAKGVSLFESRMLRRFLEED